MATMFDSIRGIHALRTEWTIKVRVLRLWKAPLSRRILLIRHSRWCFVIVSFCVAKHEFKLNFQFQTRIAQTDDDESIEKYGFEFLPASTIFAPDFDQDILVDVIERLIHMSDVQQSSSDPKTKHIPEVNEFIGGLQHEELASPIIKNLSNPAAHASTLEPAFAELPLSSWYYDSCKKCKTKMEPDGASFYCTKCDCLVHTSTCRFKVELMILDDSGTGNVTIFDKDVEGFLGISAIDLRREQLQTVDDIRQMPKKFDRFLGQMFVFKYL
ncbi:replication protein A 70 kDa DNA-binding subunit A-like [Senna tora]|uniref:Replication protein A 70 kDa DNA-binding subunit A-like n=1 Tax=Senna tora TaxID=362788 RepID=A0A834TSZ6_9FABA|nr:replication protein A 70 kDa DNA-binding subunit A-like [Senna tora]